MSKVMIPETVLEDFILAVEDIHDTYYQFADIGELRGALRVAIAKVMDEWQHCDLVEFDEEVMPGL